MDYLKYHKEHKLKISSNIKINSGNLHKYYTPGVAEPCQYIKNNPSQVYNYTWKANTIAVISDGSRILGLGNIGPSAAIPLLEGKALIFNTYANINAIPIPIASLEVNDTINLIKNISYGFGGINLEDISNPRCYDILDGLIKTLDIPVFHDDQQGTAVVILASLINALKLVNKNIKDTKIILYGIGAANTAVYRLLKIYGANILNIIAFDSKGALNNKRTDLFDVAILKEIAMNTNINNYDIKNSFKDADVLIALSKPGPNTIDIELIKTMNNDAICFVCANPSPEIDPALLKSIGVKIVATGRSDYSNQANNAIVFPGLFRGVLDARASKISWTMCVELAKNIANLAYLDGINYDYIIPKIDHPKLHFTVAKGIVDAAFKENLNTIIDYDLIINKIKTNLKIS